MVPNGWKQVDLGSLFDFKNGLNTDKEHYGSGYKFVNVMDVFGNDILTEDKIIGRVQVSDNQIVGYQLQYGDVLFNRTSETFDEIAMAAVYLDDGVATFGGFVIRGRPKSKDIYPVYSAFLFQAESYRTQAIKLGQGAVRANIGQKDLAKVNVLLPSIEEQNKIAQILSTWDKAISTTEKLLENSQQQKKALMQQLLTGKKRLLDENGAIFSGEWQRFSLGSIAKVYQPRTISQSELSTDGYPVYGANGVIGYYSDFNHELEQIAVTCRGSTCGVVNWTVPKSWITGNAMVINVDRSILVDKKFLFYVLSFSDLKYLITGSGQPQITGDIKNHIVNLALIEEQKSIAHVLTLADKEIETLQKKLDCLKQEKKALMQKLLTGKKRVKVVV